MNIRIIILFLFLFGFLKITEAQSPIELYRKYDKSFSEGDYLQAEKYLDSVLLQKDSLPVKGLIAVYNGMGLLKRKIGKYELSLKYFNLAKDISIKNFGKKYKNLVPIYGNIANLHKSVGEYENALKYYNQVMISLENLSGKEKEKIKSHTYYNTGLLYMVLKKYSKAIKYFQKSVKVKKKHNLKDLDRIYNNIAKSYEYLNDYIKADKYFKLAIKEVTDYSTDSFNHRLALIYLDYGGFKIKAGNKEEGLKLKMKSLKIYKKNYGTKHHYISTCQESIGDYYVQEKDYDKALYYYQKSIISNCENFYDNNILKNPELKSAISEFQLFNCLKKKAETLILLSDHKNASIKLLKMSLKTSELIFEMGTKLRELYTTESSKLIFVEDEKDCYITAIESALKLYEITNDDKYKITAYKYSRKSKAVVMLDEIISNEVLINVIPKKLRDEKTALQKKIFNYKKLIFKENNNVKSSDSIYRQNKLFYSTEKYDSLINVIRKDYPVYSNLLEKIKITDLKNIQNNLTDNEILIEYSLSSKYRNNKKRLYIFTITNNDLKYYKTKIDTSFEKSVLSLQHNFNVNNIENIQLEEYELLKKSLHNLYSILFLPVEPEEKEIIIVPDAEIAYISFESLISEYKKQDFINFSALPYLIKKYCFSYSYSTKLIFDINNTDKYSDYVYAFAPIYNGKNQENTRFNFGTLESSEKEIKSIMNYFNGKIILEENANEKYFKSLVDKPYIFHFAMHAKIEDKNSEFSFLLFANTNDDEDGILHNYEIDMLQMNSPMVVLSACNTGNGELSNGEGIMSLARSFLKSGVPAVVHTLWEVSDDAGAELMENFYKHLSKNKSKSNALREAKLEYIKTHNPEMVNPFFWSSYILTGNKSPIVKNNYTWFIISGIFITFGIFGMFRYKKSN